MPKEQIPRAPTRLTARELTRKLPAPRKPCPLTTPRLQLRRKACLLTRPTPKERTRLNHHHHRTTRKPTVRAREVDADLWRREQRMPRRRPAKEMLRTRKRHHLQLPVVYPHHQTPPRHPRELTPRCLHHQIPLFPSPKEVTREAILQWPHHQTPQRQSQREATKVLTPRCHHHLTQLHRNPRAETKEAIPQPNLLRRKEREVKRLSHLPRKKVKDPRPLLQIPKKARVRRPRPLLLKAALTEKELTRRELTANLLME